MFILDHVRPENSYILDGCKRGFAEVCRNPREAARKLYEGHEIDGSRTVIHDPDPEMKPGYMSIVMFPELQTFFVFRVHALKMMNGHKS